MPGMKKGLGRGLDSLITTGSELFTEEAKESIKKAVMTVDIYKVEPDRNQPRKEFDSEKLEELASSIKQYGVIEPLLVQEVSGADGNSYYQIIAGERRWRAAKLAGLKEVPVIVKDFKNEDIFVVSLIENVQREDLNPMEEALAYKRLRDEYGFTQEKLAENIGKSRTAITNSLRMLELEESVQGMVASGEISFGHAKVLAGVKDLNQQKKLAEKVSADDLSVRALEGLLAEVKPEKKQTPAKKPERNLVNDNFAKDLGTYLGTKVKVNGTDKKGKIEIEFGTAEDFLRISELLMPKGN